MYEGVVGNVWQRGVDSKDLHLGLEGLCCLWVVGCGLKRVGLDWVFVTSPKKQRI